MVYVLLCSYNGEKYISEQLLSLKNQNRKIDAVRIYDDCSTDKTAAIIQDFISKNNLDNWTLKINEFNKGWRINFFDAVCDCSPDSESFIFFCDQDDVWKPDKVKYMLEIMEKNPRILRLNGSYSLIDSNNKLIKRGSNSEKVYKENIENNLPGIHWNGNIGCTMCIRSSLLNYIRFFDRNNCFSHDLCFVLISAYLDAGFRLKKSVIDYRQHQNNESKKIAGGNRLNDACNELEVIQYYLKAFEKIDEQSEVVNWLNISKKFNSIRVSLLENLSVKKLFKQYKLYKQVGKRKTFLADFNYIIQRRKSQ